MIQMTDSGEGSKSSSLDREGLESGEKLGLEFAELSRSTPAPVPAIGLSRRWCVKDMREVYREDVQQDNRGWQTQTIFEESQIFTSRFDSDR